MTKASFFERLTVWRLRISGFLAYTSLSTLVIAIVLIAGLLIYSAAIGDWPFSYQDGWHLNHGPWRYDFGLEPNPRKHLLGYSFGFLFISVILSFPSMLLRFNRLTIAVFVGSFVSFWSAMYFLYWLID